MSSLVFTGLFYILPYNILLSLRESGVGSLLLFLWEFQQASFVA